MSTLTADILEVFEEKIPRYFSPPKETRLNQVQMALDIADFIHNSSKNILFLEAPVGTGKSLGVLVPTLLHAKEYNTSVTYATATINLQNQIFDSETTLLSNIKIIRDGDKLLAQGKSNYTCSTVYQQNKTKFTLEEQNKLYKLS